MENFERADALIANIEGGHANQTGDTGGDTWYGISRNNHLSETPWPPSVERAQEIRHQEYWNSSGCMDMPWEAAMVVYDMAILSSPRAAVVQAQKILGLKVDGYFGPISEKAIREDVLERPGHFASEYQARRLMHYMDLSLWKLDGLGWSRRLFKVAMAAAIWE